MINTQPYCAVFILMALGSLASAAEPNRLPDGIPPLTGKAVARTTDGEDSKSDWRIALTFPKDTWRAIQAVMPKLDWPEPTWENVRPGVQEGTMTLVGGSMPKWFRVVDMKGKELGRDQIIEHLKTEQPVLVSASGRMPHGCYLQLPTPAKLIVLLGPGDKQEDVAETNVPAEGIAEERAIDLKDWTEEKSQQYFFKLMQKSTTFKIESKEEASKYLQGIWRLDKRAHIGGGHYVRADRGEDVTVSCTDKWLVVTASSGSDARDMAVGRVERVEPDERGHLHVKTRNSITFDHFQPLDKDHMAVLAYDYIAVVQRISCPPRQTGESVNSQTTSSKELVLEKTREVNTEGKTDFKNAAINIGENQDAIVVGQRSLENQFLPVDSEGQQSNPIILDGWQFPIPIPGSMRVITGRSDTVSVLEPLNQLKVIGTMPHVMQAGDFVLPALSPDGKIVCTRAKLDHLQLFDAQTAQPITAPIRQTGRVLTMAFTSDSKYLCSCADDEPDVFDAKNPRPVPKTNMGDDGLRVWNPKTGELVAAFGNDISFRYIGSFAYDPIHERIVTVENSEFDVDQLSSRVLIHSIKDKREAIATIELPAHSADVRWIDPDHLLVWCDRRGTKPLFVVSLSDGQITARRMAENCVWHPEIAPDGKYFAATVKTPEGPRATCWRVGQIEPLWEHPRNIVALGDNGWVATQQRGGISQIRSLHDGRVIWQREGVLEARVKGKNLWVFTAKGYEIWHAD